uniref:Uncharacterized protein n=1 Tax=Riboviria sp. TaxID=2585031 RepID=A0A8K1U2B4_9VIRU|nr:MAG: hypothetical protein 1 [Riboviria sp.]
MRAVAAVFAVVALNATFEYLMLREYWASLLLCLTHRLCDWEGLFRPVVALLAILTAVMAYWVAERFEYNDKQPHMPSTAHRLREEQKRPKKPVASTTEDAIQAFAQSLMPEAYQPDSPYSMSSAPSFQASIWTDVTGEWILMGHALRIDDYLLVNHHTLIRAPQEVLTLMIIRSGRATVSVPLSKFVFSELYEDIWYAPIGDLALTGLTTLKVAHVEDKHVVQISTDYKTENSSTGVIENDPAWGMVTYHGSTRRGFSGAAYYVGKRAYAMHALGGNDANRGYSLSYLAQKIKRQESSDYLALTNALRVATNRRLVSKRVAPGEVEIFHLGRYYIIDSAEAEELLSPDFESSRLPRKATREMATQTFDFESQELGNGMSPQSYGGAWLRDLVTGFLPPASPEAPCQDDWETHTTSSGPQEDPKQFQEALRSIQDSLSKQHEMLASLQTANVSTLRRLTQLEMSSNTHSLPTAPKSRTQKSSSEPLQALTKVLQQALGSSPNRQRSGKRSGGTAYGARTFQPSRSFKERSNKDSGRSPNRAESANAGAPATAAPVQQT